MSSILLLLLVGGLPYYLVLEKSRKFSSKSIFLISAFFLLCAIMLSLFVPNKHESLVVIVAFINAVYTIYRASKITNFYKLGYYFIFINAPFFLLFENAGAFYSLSQLVSLVGIYLIANFYKKNYGSANYLAVRGITLKTPCVATYLTLYLIALALYPPFPNSLFFLSYVFNSDSNLLWYIVVVTLFLGNFFLAMRVMRKTLFGQPNLNIHYVHMTLKEKIIHSLVVIALLALSTYALKEMLL
jgi:hypothetical protein